MPRPRRAAAPTSFLEPPDDPLASTPITPGTSTPGDADAEFLALSARQRSAIDRAFRRGLKSAGRKGKGGTESKKRKRRETAIVDLTGDSDVEPEAGGFEPEGEGGFVVGGDDEGTGGGFDEGDVGGADDGGGFVEDEPPIDPPTEARIPLFVLPGILTSLGLPADDDVLQVFQASASGWTEEDPGSSRRRPEATDGVELKDFRAVCAALMGAEDAQEQDDFLSAASDSGSSLSTLSDTDDEYTGTARGKGKARARGGAELEEQAQIKLTSRQKEMVESIWEMVKPNAQGRGSHILGREEVKALARGLGEMWSEDEITEMVSLFSTQHEGRGLTFDDFGKVMFRAGLV